MQSKAGLVVMLCAVFGISCAQQQIPVKQAAPKVIPVAPKPEAPRQAANPMPEPVSAWSAIGRVNRQRGGFCTGMLIAPDKVLTTSRCVWDTELRSWIHPSDLHFLAGYHLGKYVAHRRAVEIQLPRNIRMTRRGTPRKTDNDWAILVLNEPIADYVSVRPIPLIASEVDFTSLRPLLRVGYGWARPHVAESTSCYAIGRLTPTLLLHDCGGSRRHSGFAVMVESADGWQVVGLEMGTRNGNKDSAGVGMTLLISAASVGRFADSLQRRQDAPAPTLTAAEAFRVR